MRTTEIERDESLLANRGGFSSSCGHFLPYSWLHRTRAYILLAVVAAFGPFALLMGTGPQASFHLTGFLVGAALLTTAFVVRIGADRLRRSAPDQAPA